MNLMKDKKYLDNNYSLCKWCARLWIIWHY